MSDQHEFRDRPGSRRRQSSWPGGLSPVLGAIARDGRYLSDIPVIGALLPLLAAAIGLAAGLLDRGGLPYTASLGMLAALTVLGILSGRMGLWTFAGFVIADSYSLLNDPATEPNWAYVGGILLSWFFLFQLLAFLPAAARQMAGLRGRWFVLNGLISAMLGAAFVELWTRLSMVALRPLFIWRGEETPLELVYFADPSNEWGLGFLVLHKLAWAALATGLARWLIEAALAQGHRAEQRAPFRVMQYQRSRIPWWLAAMGKSSASTAMIAGVFASIAGAFAFWLAVMGAITLRTFASANRFVVRWDRWMFCIPAAVRLIAGYVLCFYLAESLADPLRDNFGWRTMTVAAAATAVVFTISLAFWPQVLPGRGAPPIPAALDRLLGSVGRATPRAMLFVLMFVATAAQAHHCSFQPGCECLTDDAALAALLSGAATAAQIRASRQMDWIVIDGAKLEAAHDYWVYAAMSNNIYSDGNKIGTPGWRQVDTMNNIQGLFVDDVGFYAETWVREENGQVIDVSIVFRGSEKKLSDWGDNLFPALSTPQSQVARIYGETVSSWYPGANIVATGHSLGGALAKAAVEGTGNKAVVFNSSPRGWDGDNVIHIEEAGDALDYLRDNRTGDIQYDFQDGSKKEAHNIYTLADGMRKWAGQN